MSKVGGPCWRARGWASPLPTHPRPGGSPRPHSKPQLQIGNLLAQPVVLDVNISITVPRN